MKIKETFIVASGAIAFAECMGFSGFVKISGSEAEKLSEGDILELLKKEIDAGALIVTESEDQKPVDASRLDIILKHPGAGQNIFRKHLWGYSDEPAVVYVTCYGDDNKILNISASCIQYIEPKPVEKKKTTTAKSKENSTNKTAGKV